MDDDKIQKVYVKFNRNTESIELIDFPYPEKKRDFLNAIYQEFAFEPFCQETLEKMNQFVLTRLESIS
jgi:hypothetical protein